MKYKFYKYQGTGNDFIIFDNRKATLSNNNDQLYNQLCNRKFGIGADGLMLLENTEGYDFKMVYYNADGSESTMCGNGGRCLVNFAKELGIVEKEAKFLAVDGPHYAKISDNQVELQMIDVRGVKKISDDYLLNTGSPHYVKFVENLNVFDIYNEGKKIRNSAAFVEEGVNVNFVEIQNETLFVRTYERGVEDETLSCGTGVTAAAIAYSFAKNLLGNQHINIKTLGGTLSVDFFRNDNVFESVFLNGPAEKVFEGELNLNS